VEKLVEFNHLKKKEAWLVFIIDENVNIILISWRQLKRQSALDELRALLKK
jgi:uncharacterized protein YfbU (UPF0304 family)